MEDLGSRFPSISQIILNNVDNNSLANFRKASRENSIFLDSERFYWIRNIKKYSANFEEFQDSWKKVVCKTPVKFLKNLAFDLHSFFKCVSTRYETQWHPLLIGARQGLLSLCEHVVERTGDVNPKSIGGGFTPLDFAAQKGHLEICVFLIKYLDDKNPANADRGTTPLHRAAYFGHVEICKLLFDHIGDEISLDKDGMTPIHMAAQEGHLEVCNFMLNHTTRIPEVITAGLLYT